MTWDELVEEMQRAFGTPERMIGYINALRMYVAYIKNGGSERDFYKWLNEIERGIKNDRISKEIQP